MAITEETVFKIFSLKCFYYNILTVYLLVEIVLNNYFRFLISILVAQCFKLYSNYIGTNYPSNTAVPIYVVTTYNSLKHGATRVYSHTILPRPNKKKQDLAHP